MENKWRTSKLPLANALNEKRALLTLETLTLPHAHDKELLRRALSHSHYLNRTAEQDTTFIETLFNQEPEETLNTICAHVSRLGDEPDRNKVAAELRQQKKRAAFLIALADIAQVWSLEQVMKANTQFADACLKAAIRHLVNSEPKIKNKNNGAGLLVFAMGKYGADELNYSSDIDIIIFYDSALYAQPEEARQIYPKLARALVALLQEQTQDGYVFRVDLSLRPDPGTTQAAISFQAAQAYYENLGQNWERCAFIKARFVVGDENLALTFLTEMNDFIWRKYLDYAVLEDIHAMKRQAHAAIGWDEKTTDLDGRDIKRASGGIRDIEMFVQSQQLIAGGRDKRLRRKKTCEMLVRLAASKWITKDAARTLIEAYRFLRNVEHRAQMVADQQTHKLPNSPEGWKALACFCGFQHEEDFQEKLRATLDQVRDHYQNLFKQSASLGTKSGGLVFTGGEDDPETLHTLSTLGFDDPAFVAKTVRSWHSGRMPAATSARTRELLTELVPSFLEALAEMDEPQKAFLRLDRFFSALQSAVQFFALLQSNPQWIKLIALICGTAPRLANTLAKSPQMIEGMIQVLTSTPADTLLEDLEMTLSNAKHYEEVLDSARVWVAEQHFNLSIQILENKTGGMDAAKQFSNIAEASIIALQEKTQEEFNKRNKKFNAGAGDIAVLAAGSLGAREMTIISDLDIMFIYDPLEGGSLEGQNYHTRLAQSFVQALTAPTAKGSLYEVDMRLRPSGKAGPIALTLDAFKDYQHNRAWVWEHMALTRTRPLTGSTKLQKQLHDIIYEVLTKKREPDTLKQAVLDMRLKIKEARPPKGAWDISATFGGLTDAEFICQYMLLAHAHENPSILSHSTIDAFEKITAAGIADLSPLLEAEIFFKQVVQLLHLSVGRVGDDGDIPLSLQALLVKATASADWNDLKKQRDKHYQAVQNYFSRLGG